MKVKKSGKQTAHKIESYLNETATLNGIKTPKSVSMIRNQQVKLKNSLKSFYWRFSPPTPYLKGNKFVYLFLRLLVRNFANRELSYENIKTWLNEYPLIIPKKRIIAYKYKGRIVTGRDVKPVMIKVDWGKLFTVRQFVEYAVKVGGLLPIAHNETTSHNLICYDCVTSKEAENKIAYLKRKNGKVMDSWSDVDYDNLADCENVIEALKDHVCRDKITTVTFTYLVNTNICQDMLDYENNFTNGRAIGLFTVENMGQPNPTNYTE